MATSPTLTESDFGAIVESGTGTGQTITLPPTRAHWVYHCGVDTSGTTTTDTIFLHQSDSVAASFAAAVGKFPLKPGYAARIKPGTVTLYHRTAANSPTFAIIAEELDFGVH